MFMLSGERINVSCLRPEQVHLSDMAHVLGRLPRANGNLVVPVTDADHAIYVALIAVHAEGFDTLTPLLQAETLLWALLHDAHETYLTDLPTPLKSYAEKLVALKPVVDRVIYESLGVSFPSRLAQRRVHYADKVAMATEGHMFMHPAFMQEYGPQLPPPSNLFFTVYADAGLEWSEHVQRTLKELKEYSHGV